jgi:hypothetical protein
MDYTPIILNNENEIIDCRRVNECGDIEFHGYMAHFFQELGDYLEEVDFIMEMIKMYIEKEYCGDKERFVKDISHCSDYYYLTDYFRKMFDIKGS